MQLFADCGWEYIQDYVGYSYFRKPAATAGSDEIFCDDESRREMLREVFHRQVASFGGDIRNFAAAAIYIGYVRRA